jgi:hypothetical protein
MTNLGLSHLQVALGEYAVTFLLGLSALLYTRVNEAMAFPILIGWVIFLTGITTLITALERKHT